MLFISYPKKTYEKKIFMFLFLLNKKMKKKLNIQKFKTETENGQLASFFSITKDCLCIKKYFRSS